MNTQAQFLKSFLYAIFCTVVTVVTMILAVLAIDLIVAPRLIHISEQLSVVNWNTIVELFWLSMIGIIVCGIVACMVGKSFRKTEKSNNSTTEKKEQVDKNWPGTQP